MTRFLNERMEFRAREGTKMVLEALCHKYPDAFESPSHIIRSAVEKFIREQRTKGYFIGDTNV